jgi:hypothetical protein
MKEHCVEEELIIKGKQLVAELGKEQELSARWMAHYVAELMEKADSRDEETSQASAKLCADLILKLWEVKSKKRIIEVERDLQFWFKNRPDYDSDDHHERLKAALDNPESIGAKVSVETALDLRALRDVEDDLLRLWLVIEATEKPSDQKMNEIASEFSKSDADVLRINERLSKLFARFAEIPLTDVPTLRREILKALQSVDQLKHAVLYQRVEASREKKVRKATRKKGSK